MIDFIFGFLSILGIVTLLRVTLFFIGSDIYEIKRIFKRRKLSKVINFHPRNYQVTVLIPAHNEEAVIIRCLESVFKSEYKRIKVVVVNDGSTDQTKTLVNNYKALNKLSNLKLINKENSGKADSLNLALGNVRSALVMVLDADSIITLNLTILNSSSSVDTQTVCDTLVWIDGKTYTYSTNLPKKTFKNSVGCDSVVTLNLTVLKSNFGVDRKTACDSFTWIDGVTYTNSNNSATHTIKNAAGCDSLVYLDLKIKNSTTGTDTKVACGSYTWIDGITYTSNNNTAKDTLANKAGCDSIVTLNLTITNSTTGIDTQVACDSFTWIDGITYTTSNNTAKDTLINGVGCDSVVTLNLTINTVDTSTITNGIVITSNASNASHQWIDCKNENKPIAGENGVSFTPEANGDYAVIVTENACVDTSACVTISIVGLAENSSKQIIKLIPNPNNGSFKVDLGETHFQSLEVVNLQGQIVFQKEIENRKIVDINIGQSISSKGVYLLRLNGNGGSVTHRFVVE